jgi:hypothetical protein
MSLELLQEFFLWCTVINFGIYLLTVVALFAFRGTVVAIHRRLFSMDEDAVNRSFHQYLAAHKLFTTVFCFVPWVALLLIQ